ncbi:MAG: NifB/NifX family molybdenum-iron cluster-binding protein [Candidatus Bathyarchaeia archaeon]
MKIKTDSLKVAVATEGNKGLEDRVSHGFGHCKTFTLLNIEDGEIKKVEVIANPAESVSHGRGPLLAQHLAKMNVNLVIAGEFGPGASAMLEEHGIKMLRTTPEELVANALKNNSLIK